MVQPIGPTALSPTHFPHSSVLLFQQNYKAAPKTEVLFLQKAVMQNATNQTGCNPPQHNSKASVQDAAP